MTYSDDTNCTIYTIIYQKYVQHIAKKGVHTRPAAINTSDEADETPVSRSNYSSPVSNTNPFVGVGPQGHSSDLPSTLGGP